MDEIVDGASLFFHFIKGSLNPVSSYTSHCLDGADDGFILNMGDIAKVFFSFSSLVCTEPLLLD